MTLKYIKKCGDSWIACTAQASKGEVGLEPGVDNRTLYQYIFYGSLKIAEPFSDSSKTLELTKGKLFDVKELLGKNIVYEFLEDTHIFGFNRGVSTDEDGKRSEDSTIDWSGKLIEKNEEITVAKKSILVCLDGSPVVNGKTLARYDYDELSTSKTYNIELKTNGVLALFTQV
tara:strand:- start:29 stop:547 length:519 start_codon:yes stop_codon:yes gene_type:complete